MDDACRWLIELLVDDGTDQEDAENHLNRFKDHGSYSDLRPSKWRVIRFCLPGKVLVSDDSGLIQIEVSREVATTRKLIWNQKGKPSKELQIDGIPRIVRMDGFIVKS